MKILAVSDNHGDKEALKNVLAMYPDMDHYIHCGDSEMMAQEMDPRFIKVLGNHDYLMGSNAPIETVLEAGGHRFLICHGHMHFLSYFHYDPMIRKAREKGCDTVIFGHVHTYCDRTEDGMRLLNPGSVWHNRDGTPPSFMIITIEGDTMTAERVTYTKPAREKKEKKGFFAKLFGG